MEKPGGSELRGILEKLTDEIDEYFGALNELKLGIRKISQVPPPPYIFLLYMQTKEMGVPLVEGGLQDQPYIWLDQYATCLVAEQQWEMLNQE